MSLPRKQGYLISLIENNALSELKSIDKLNEIDYATITLTDKREMLMAAARSGSAEMMKYLVEEKNPEYVNFEKPINDVLTTIALKRTEARNQQLRLIEQNRAERQRLEAEMREIDKQVKTLEGPSL